MPDQPSVSASRRAVHYAETKLAVNDIYKEAVTARNGLDQCLDKLAELRDVKRSYENSILDREMDLSADERSKHPDMSDAAMGRHLKIIYHRDSVLTEARSRLDRLSSDLEGLEFDKSILDTDIKIAVARMNELGGYLGFLAAVKMTSNLGGEK